MVFRKVNGTPPKRSSVIDRGIARLRMVVIFSHDSMDK
jgi:hypothetical protein